MEEIDARDRARNVVITGLSESGPLGVASTDEEKCAHILEIVGCTGTPVTCWRVGKKKEGQQRQLIVQTPSADERERVLANTARLKEAGATYKKVYVKKDVHPAFRREWMRLRNAEKEKPENVGCDIKLDTKRRVLMRDAVIMLSSIFYL